MALLTSFDLKKAVFVAFRLATIIFGRKCVVLCAVAIIVEKLDSINGKLQILLYWGAIKSEWGRYIGCKKNAVCFGMLVTR